METIASEKMSVPFLDLHAQYAAIKSEIDAAIERVIRNTSFSGGPEVEAFENEFAAYCRVAHGIGVGSGTEALMLTLLALGIGPGDEVITAANTFIATAEAISQVGARPVLVDVDPVTYTMDPEKVEAAITRRTRVVIPVHLYGQMAPMQPIADLARKHGLLVIEDACQAHGAACGGQLAGSFGIAGCFSFYPGKNLGAYGEAGMIVTGDGELATRLKRLRDHGQSRKYYHEEVGFNSRMDGLQAAVLRAKLTHLDAWNENRREHAANYRRLLGGNPRIALPVELPGRKHIYHIYAVRVPRRDRVIEALNEEGIHCGIHYPQPIHLQNAYRDLGYLPGAFPVVEQLAAEELSLPMYAELRHEHQERVAEALAAALDRQPGE